MVTVEKSQKIDASPEDVFEFLDDPQNVADISPGISKMEEIERTDEGVRSKWTYDMAGIEFDGESIPTAYDPPEKFGFRLEGPIEGSLEWKMTEEDDGTRVDFRGEYDIPDAAPDIAVEKFNEKKVGEMLDNLRDHFA